MLSYKNIGGWQALDLDLTFDYTFRETQSFWHGIALGVGEVSRRSWSVSHVDREPDICDIQPFVDKFGG